MVGCERSGVAAGEIGGPRLYGRRRGRPLRDGQQRLKEELLPRFALTTPERGILDPVALFPARPGAIWCEIGFGAGEHLVEQAIRHPEVGFIGCEAFENGVVRLLGEIERRRITNIRLFTSDARLLLEFLPPASINRTFILFPDPWPKARHHKRRLVAPRTLDRLALLMAPGAELRLATDDADYQRWMLDHLTRRGDFVWTARRPRDWRERPSDWPETRYERKARSAGRAPVFLRFLRQPVGGAGLSAAN